jgi:hypothetical protein
MRITRKHSIKGRYSAMFYDALLYVVFAGFKAIHWQHFKDTWNGKPRYKLLEIYGFRTALVDNVCQRCRVTFYFKVGKYYI